MVPAPRPSVRKFVQGILGVVRPRAAALVRVVDWSRFEDDFGNEDLARLACAFPEALSTWKAQVGVVFEETEIERLAAFCARVVDQGMSAYLYVPNVSTLMLWEGDLVDFWSDNKAVLNAFMTWSRQEELVVTSETVG